MKHGRNQTMSKLYGAQTFLVRYDCTNAPVVELADTAGLSPAARKSVQDRGLSGVPRGVVEKYHTAFGKQRRRGSTFHPDF